MSCKLLDVVNHPWQQKLLTALLPVPEEFDSDDYTVACKDLQQTIEDNVGTSEFLHLQSSGDIECDIQDRLTGMLHETAFC